MASVESGLRFPVASQLTSEVEAPAKPGLFLPSASLQVEASAKSGLLSPVASLTKTSFEFETPLVSFFPEASLTSTSLTIHPERLGPSNFGVQKRVRFDLGSGGKHDGCIPTPPSARGPGILGLSHPQVVGGRVESSQVGGGGLDLPGVPSSLQDTDNAKDPLNTVKSSSVCSSLFPSLQSIHPSVSHSLGRHGQKGRGKLAIWPQEILPQASAGRNPLRTFSGSGRLCSSHHGVSRGLVGGGEVGVPLLKDNLPEQSLAGVSEGPATSAGVNGLGASAGRFSQGRLVAGCGSGSGLAEPPRMPSQGPDQTPQVIVQGGGCQRYPRVAATDPRAEATQPPTENVLALRGSPHSEILGGLSRENSPAASVRPPLGFVPSPTSPPQTSSLRPKFFPKGSLCPAATLVPSAPSGQGFGLQELRPPQEVCPSSFPLQSMCPTSPPRLFVAPVICLPITDVSWPMVVPLDTEGNEKIEGPMGTHPIRLQTPPQGEGVVWGEDEIGGVKGVPRASGKNV